MYKTKHISTVQFWFKSASITLFCSVYSASFQLHVLPLWPALCFMQDWRTLASDSSICSSLIHLFLFLNFPIFSIRSSKRTSCNFLSCHADIVMCKPGSFTLVLSRSQFLSNVLVKQKALPSSAYEHLHLIFWTCSNACVCRWLTRVRASCQQCEKRNVALFVMKNKSARIGLFKQNRPKRVNCLVFLCFPEKTKQNGTFVGAHLDTVIKKKVLIVSVWRNSTARSGSCSKKNDRFIQYSKRVLSSFLMFLW